MLQVFDQMLTQCGLKKFVAMHVDTYVYGREKKEDERIGDDRREYSVGVCEK